MAEEVVATLDRRKTATKAPKPVLTSWLGDEAGRGAPTISSARGIASFATSADAIDGFMQLVRYARAQKELMRTPPALPEDLRLKTDAANEVIATALADGRSVLSEVEAKAVLTAYGIPIVPTDVAAISPGSGRGCSTS